MANYADLLAAEEKKNKQATSTPLVIEAKEEPIIQPPDQSTSQSTDRPNKNHTPKATVKKTSQSVGQSTSRSVSRPNYPGYSKTVDRPKAFYITERLDRKLDEAVRYLQDTHGIKKVDRSTIINALLDNDAYWTDKSLDLLVDRVISQLTSRLTGK